MAERVSMFAVRKTLTRARRTRHIWSRDKIHLSYLSKLHEYSKQLMHNKKIHGKLTKHAEQKGQICICMYFYNSWILRRNYHILEILTVVPQKNTEFWLSTLKFGTNTKV